MKTAERAKGRHGWWASPQSVPSSPRGDFRDRQAGGWSFRLPAKTPSTPLTLPWLAHPGSALQDASPPASPPRASRSPGQPLTLEERPWWAKGMLVQESRGLGPGSTVHTPFVLPRGSECDHLEESILPPSTAVWGPEVQPMAGEC